MERPNNTVKNGKSNVRSLITELLLLVAIAALVYMWTIVDGLKAEIDARPPIAILDVNGIAMQQIDGAPGTTAEEAQVAAYKVGETLAGNGYVVVHKSSIVAYPAEFEVSK